MPWRLSMNRSAGLPHGGRFLALDLNAKSKSKIKSSALPLLRRTGRSAVGNIKAPSPTNLPAD
jgi:hypothetical protein